MEKIGGEPDVVGYDKKTREFIFYDCSAESPKGRRSVCYDREALEARKEHKPKNSAMDMAAAMGVELLTEQEYQETRWSALLRSPLRTCFRISQRRKYPKTSLGPFGETKLRLSGLISHGHKPHSHLQSR
jgi:Protein of unknown function (DUF4256)